MKVGGPKGPAGIPPPAAQPSEKTTPAQGPHFAELLAPKAAGTDPAISSSALEEVSAKLKAGQIDVQQAVEQIVEGIIKSRGQSLSAAAQDHLRSRLIQLLADDPFLSAKMKKLTKLSEE